jgi:hypothetical protein
MELLILAKLLLIKMFIRRGSRLEPCSTPDKSEEGDGNILKIRTKKNLFNK